MRSALIVGLVILSLLALTLTASSQSATLVEGQVKDHKGEPVANQTVVVYGTSFSSWKMWGGLPFPSGREPVQLLAVTNKKGFFQIADLPPGQYTIKLVVSGTEPVRIADFNTPYGYRKVDLTEKLTLSEELSTQVRKAPAPPSEHIPYRGPEPSGVMPSPAIPLPMPR